MTTNYQVFNPLTGTHTKYTSEQEAKDAVTQIASSIVDTYKPTVCQELSNENGDTTWVAVDLIKKFNISVE